jgi:hypothetical protein
MLAEKYGSVILKVTLRRSALYTPSYGLCIFLSLTLKAPATSRFQTQNFCILPAPIRPQPQAKYRSCLAPISTPRARMRWKRRFQIYLQAQFRASVTQYSQRFCRCYDIVGRSPQSVQACYLNVAAPLQNGVLHTFRTTPLRQETKFHTNAKQVIQLSYMQHVDGRGGHSLHECGRMKLRR